MLTTDFQLFGAICIVLGLIFYTNGLQHRYCQWFYKIMPVMVACYFLPSLLNTFGVIAVPHSQLPELVGQYLMPSCLCLLLLGLDVRTIFSRGGKLLLLFFIGSAGIFVGGPFALKLVAMFKPELLLDSGENSLWRGMTTLAGNWVGGTANQLAVKQLYHVGDSIFAVFVTVNVLISGIWMALLLALAPHQQRLNQWLGCREVLMSVAAPEQQPQAMADLPKLMLLISIPLMLTGLGNALATEIAIWFSQLFPAAKAYQFDSPFMWKMILITTGSVMLSLSPARKLAIYGADKLGAVCLYLMLAIMGLKMDIRMLLSLPWFFVIGAIWLLIHIVILVVATRCLRLPFSYLAIASQCNLGGAASAPVVASAYNKALMPLAVLIAVFGYAWANFIAWASGQWMQTIH